jgi:hypothetical protein
MESPHRAILMRPCNRRAAGRATLACGAFTRQTVRPPRQIVAAVRGGHALVREVQPCLTQAVYRLARCHQALLDLQSRLTAEVREAISSVAEQDGRQPACSRFPCGSKSTRLSVLTPSTSSSPAEGEERAPGRRAAMCPDGVRSPSSLLEARSWPCMRAGLSK